MTTDMPRGFRWRAVLLRAAAAACRPLGRFLAEWSADTDDLMR